MRCPRCGLINPEGAQRCGCGYDFETQTVEEPSHRQAPPGRADFSKAEAIRFGWKTTKDNFKFLVPLMLFTGLVFGFPGILDQGVALGLLTLPRWARILWVGLGLLQVMIPMGLINISLALCRQEQPRFSHLFPGFRVLFRYIWGSIIYSFFVGIGLVFLVIPGIVVAIQHGFFPYLIADHKGGGWKAFLKSREVTKGCLWNLFLFFLLLGAINALGALCLVGVLLSVPTTMVAVAFAYRKLEAQAFGRPEESAGDRLAFPAPVC